MIEVGAAISSGSKSRLPDDRVAIAVATRRFSWSDPSDVLMIQDRQYVNDYCAYYGIASALHFAVHIGLECGPGPPMCT